MISENLVKILYFLKKRGDKKPKNLPSSSKEAPKPVKSAESP